MEKKSVYANMAQKEETVQESTAFTKHGRQTNQKLKPYIVLQYLLKNTDENSVAFSYKHKKRTSGLDVRFPFGGGEEGKANRRRADARKNAAAQRIPAEPQGCIGFPLEFR